MQNGRIITLKDSAKKSSKSDRAGKPTCNLNNHLNYDQTHRLILAQKIGNQAMQRLIHSDIKSNVSNPTSSFKQDADWITDKNVNMNTSIPTSSQSSRQSVPGSDLHRSSQKHIESSKTKNLPLFDKTKNLPDGS